MEEEDARVYDDFAEGLRDSYPQQAEKFRDLRRQEDGHRHRLLDLYRARFGEHVPLVRREDIRGFAERRPIWSMRPCRPQSRAASGPPQGVGDQEFL